MMTNKQFEKIMAECGEAHSKYLSLLNEIEGEYERRYGQSPSEFGDDFWIDTFHFPPGGAVGITVSKLEEASSIYWKLYNKRHGTDTAT